MNGAAVAAPRSGSRRALIAGFLLVVMLAVFAAAFLAFGGVQIVHGLLGSQPVALSGGPNAQGVPVATSTPSASITLPPGVDETFAKRVYVEQLESQENIQKLVNGEVTKFTYGKVDRTTSDAVINMRAYFKDGTSAPGIVGMAAKQGTWFFAYIAGRAPATTAGLASSVSRGVDENSPQHLAKIAAAKVDTEVVSTMLSQELQSQETLAGLVAGKQREMIVDGVTTGQGTATLAITMKSTGGVESKAELICITKQVDGKQSWFITTFKKV